MLVAAGPAAAYAGRRANQEDVMPVDGNLLRAIAPHFSGARERRQAEIIAALDPVLDSTLARYDINTPLRVAHFIAQVAHECAGFCTTEEFASGEAYEGRKDLGNIEPGDGRRYKGRGLIQLTGRANYRQYGTQLQLNLEDDPVQAAEPATSLLVACEYWKSRHLNDFADNDDEVTITKRINGGLNGLDDRRNYLRKAKAALADGAAPADNGGDQPILRKGATGGAVARLQEMLQSKGIAVNVDSNFGPGTEQAVIQFQTAENLTADGVVGPDTWLRLG
jgi:putative chitinase